MTQGVVGIVSASLKKTLGYPRFFHILEKKTTLEAREILSAPVIKTELGIPENV